MTESIPHKNESAKEAPELLDAACPSCSRRLKVPARKVGLKIHCPVCNGVFRVKPPVATPAGNATRGDLPAAGNPPASTPARTREPRPGSVFANRFDIVRKLGSGTFGTVYHAFDIQEYCEVALKVPDEDMLFNPQFMVRFRAEAEILKRMRHPNIVTFYGAQLDCPPRYLVAEFIKGRDLEHELARARKEGRWMDRTDAVWIVEKLARALHHAHKKNVIHRDVKPANILISGDIVKLTDFGLARFGDPNLTQAGAKIGTPFYMSPEQVAGDPAGVDARTDQFGLGVVLFELLCRRRPFDGMTSEAVFVKLLNDPTPRLIDIDASIPSELAEVCEKALAKDPADRWPDCDAFAAALKPWVPRDHRAGPRRPAEPPENDPALTGTDPDEFAVTNENAPRPASTIADPLIKGLKPITSRISETVKKGKQTLAPLASAVEPLGKSLGTTVKISSRTIRSRWPSWVQSFVGLLAGWVDRFNEHLSNIAPVDHDTANDLEEDVSVVGPAVSANVEALPVTSSSSSPIEASSLAQLSSGQGSAPIPLASMGENRPPLVPIRTPLLIAGVTGSLAASQAGDAKRLSSFDSIKAAHNAWCEHRRGDAIFHLDRCPDDRRSWEWAYLQALCRSPITNYSNHTGEISALAFDRSGRLLGADDEKGVAVWDTSTHRVVRRLTATLKRVDSIAFSADGRWLVASGGKTIRVYDLEAPGGDDPVHVLQGHDALVNRVAFAADGIHLASAGLDQSIRIWSVREGVEVLALRAKAGAVHTLAFHPYDPELLLSSHGNGTLIVWDWAEACERHRGTAPTGAAIDTLAIHPNGRMLAAGARDGTIAFAELASLAFVSSFQGHVGQVSALAIDPSGRWLVSLGGGKERSIRVGAADPAMPPAELGRTALVLPFGARALKMLAFSPAGDGRIALAGGRDGTVKLWDAAGFWASLAAAGAGGDRARAVAIHPEGSYRAVARLDGTIEVRNLAIAAQPRSFSSGDAAVNALAFQPRQLYLLSAGDDGSVTFWDIVGGELAVRLQAHPGAVLAAAFDPAGQLLATSGTDGTVRIWDAQRHTLLHMLPGHGEKPATSVAFASVRGEPRVYSGGADRLIHVWDPRTGERVASLDEHQQKVVSLAPSADGRQVVSVGEDRMLIVWSTSRSEPLLVLNNIDVLAGIAWHQSASVLAAVGEDRSLILETLPRHHEKEADD